MNSKPGWTELISYGFYCVGSWTSDSEGSGIDYVVPTAGGGADSAENSALLCKHCNPSKNDLDLIEWWAIQGKTLEMLDLDVLTVYIRNMFRLLSDEDRLYEPAPGPT